MTNINDISGILETLSRVGPEKVAVDPHPQELYSLKKLVSISLHQLNQYNLINQDPIGSFYETYWELVFQP